MRESICFFWIPGQARNDNIMKLRLNGEIKQIENSITVSGLLESLQIEPARVAVEVNLKIIKKADYLNHQLNEGDSVEIVSFVGGG
jgi:thiamine biosynthesis protein ThiS